MDTKLGNSFADKLSLKLAKLSILNQKLFLPPFTIYNGDRMRRFNWRKFRRKGVAKLHAKDEILLEKKVDEIKTAQSGGGIKEISREVLPEE